MQLLLAIFLVVCSKFSFALDAPQVQISAPRPNTISVSFQADQAVSGFNIYHNGAYKTTIARPANSNSFEFSGTSGSYCVVGFVRSGSSVDFSPCSAEERIGGVPSTPQNFRADTYSSTSAELFWGAASDNQGVVGYEIYQDGQLINQRAGHSFFFEFINLGRLHRFELVAVDAAGNKSAPATLSLGGSPDIPQPANPQPSNPQPPGSVNFSLSTEPRRMDLTEGNSAEAVVSLRLNTNGDGGDSRVQLQIEEGPDTRGLIYSFDHTTLQAGQTTTQLRVKLPVGAAALNYHERRIIVRAMSDQGTSRTEVVFDVKPINAPDVYLLIGQSNMVGFSLENSKNANPGGPDEKHPRIRQLNVTNNNRSIFAEAGDFTADWKNVASPRYITAEDPLHSTFFNGFSRKGGTHIGPGLSFAKVALLDTTQEIYLVPAAWSGTGFCANNMGEVSWNASRTEGNALGGTLLVERALARLNTTLRETGGILRGILWHQGEADSNNPACADTYQNNVQRLVERIRREAAVDRRGSSARGNSATVPFIVGTMSRGNGNNGNFAFFGPIKDKVDFVHRQISSVVPWSDFANADDLVPPGYECGSGSCVHFGASAYRELGRRYYSALRRVQEQIVSR